MLAALAAAFAAAFAAQRARSVLLAVEDRADEAATIAAATGLLPVEVLALLELHGGELVTGEWRARAVELAAAERVYGHIALAVLAIGGQESLATRLRAEAGPEPGRIEAAVRRERAAVERAVRFLETAARLADRLPLPQS